MEINNNLYFDEIPVELSALILVKLRGTINIKNLADLVKSSSSKDF